MRWQTVMLLVFLAGCAGGVILKDKPSDPSGAAYIEVISDEQFWIRPEQSRDRQLFKAPGIWVSDGWFALEGWCYYPKNQTPDALYDFGNGTSINLHFLAGHHYTLQCDPDVWAKLDLIDTTTGQDLSKTL